jgi:hypothetical protein
MLQGPWSGFIKAPPLKKRTKSVKRLCGGCVFRALPETRPHISYFFIKRKKYTQAQHELGLHFEIFMLK